MHSKYATLVGALFAGAAHATSGLLGAVKPITSGLIPGTSKALAPTVFKVAKAWEHDTIFSGSAGGDLNLDLGLAKAFVKGDVQVAVAENFLLAPTMRIDLAGLEAYFEVDVAASASIYQSLELVASEALTVDVPGIVNVQLGAGIALDLIVSVQAAIQAHVGFQVKFPVGSFLEFNILTKEIVAKKLDGLVAVPLGVGVGADVQLGAGVAVGLSLRLRVEAGLDVDVDLLKGIKLPIGVDAKVAIWAVLFHYTAVLTSTPACALSVAETFNMAVGIAVEVGAEIGDILDLNLAPAVFVTIAEAKSLELCLPSGGNAGAIGGGLGNAIANNTNTNPGKGNGGSGSSNSGNSANAGNGFNNSTGSAGAAAGSSGANSASATATSSGTLTAAAGQITSTVTTTEVHTLTSCVASVPNCPASLTQQIVTTVVKSTVVVCPSGGTATYPTATIPTSTPDVTVQTTVTLTTCPATTSTFTVPADCPTPVPTITITPGSPPATTYPASSEAPKPSGYPSNSPPPATSIPYPTGNGTVPHPPTTKVPCEKDNSCPPPTTLVPSYPATTVPPPKPSAPSVSDTPSVPCTTCAPVQAGAAKVGGSLVIAVVGALFIL